MSQSQVIHTPYGVIYYDSKTQWRFPGSEEESIAALNWARERDLLHDQESFARREATIVEARRFQEALDRRDYATLEEISNARKERQCRK